MDEFLFFDPRALPVILPTLANGAALILTSSIAPNAADDLMRLFDAKYSDGTRVVNVLNWIEACPACNKANRADRCTHVVRRPQHFTKNPARLRALLGVFGGGHYEREMLNVADEPTRRPAFKAQDLQFLGSLDAIYRHEYAVQRFIVCIDPNAGSLSSDFALISIAIIRLNGVDYTVILGADVISMCDGVKAGELLLAHIAGVRMVRGFEKAEALVIIESNYFGWAPQIIRHVQLSDTRNVTFLRDDPLPNAPADEIRPGSRTSHANKIPACEMLVSLTENHTLLVHQHFVSGMPEHSLYENILDEMQRQLARFQRVVTPSPNDPTRRATVKYTGKYTGKDDIVMSLSLGVFHYNRCQVNPRLISHH